VGRCLRLAACGQRHRMNARVRTALALAIAACALAPAAASAKAQPITIGVAEQSPSLFTNPSFQATRIGTARIFVAWDAVLDPAQRAPLDQWFAAAKADGDAPLVTFSVSRVKRHTLPTTAQFTAMFKVFHARYPWVKAYSTWNEANSCGSLTCNKAKQVEQWWRAIRVACVGCTVLAADLVDSPNIASWVKAFRHATTTAPKVWGLHNYIDVNRRSTKYTRETLKAIGSAALWLDETGGIVSRHNKSTLKLPQGFTHAANATAYLFSTIRRISPRIQRIYLYDWFADKPPTTWDSAFLSNKGVPRHSYTVLRQWLTRLASAGDLTGRLPAHR
jgi:hypothetical protein